MWCTGWRRAIPKIATWVALEVLTGCVGRLKARPGCLVSSPAHGVLLRLRWPKECMLEYTPNPIPGPRVDLRVVRSCAPYGAQVRAACV